MSMFGSSKRKAEKQAMEEEMQKLRDELASVTKTLQENETNLKTARQLGQAADLKAKSLESQVQEMQSKNKSVAEEYERKIGQLKAEHLNKLEELQESRMTVPRRTDGDGDGNDDMAALQEQHDELLKRNEELEDQLKDARKMGHSAGLRATRLEGRLREIESEKDTLKEEYEKLEKSSASQDELNRVKLDYAGSLERLEVELRSHQRLVALMHKKHEQEMLAVYGAANGMIKYVVKEQESLEYSTE